MKKKDIVMRKQKFNVAHLPQTDQKPLALCQLILMWKINCFDILTKFFSTQDSPFALIVNFFYSLFNSNQ